MALYALDDDDLIFASSAEPGKRYWCLECFLPVKLRRGKNRFPHFYHTQGAPKCRLYSKSEDHMIAQIQLQKLFPEGALQIERPFPQICRIADLCWEKEKIIFEIQCSPMQESEAMARIYDYRTVGFETVWLLDDRRYNKFLLRPAEEFLRSCACYYIDLNREGPSSYYDQFEIIASGMRRKKGGKLKIDLQKPAQILAPLDNPNIPKQILKRASLLYFWGDRLTFALRSEKNPSLMFAMENWRALEIQLGQPTRKPSRLKTWLRRYIASPYLSYLERLAAKY
ncbi:MAG: competence protein CoiA family protein [Chlamydiota bacterium]